MLQEVMAGTSERWSIRRGRLRSGDLACGARGG